MKYENKLVIILFFTFGFVFFDRLALNFLFTDIQAEFDLKSGDIGIFSSALGFTWAIAGVIVGRLSDKLGKRKPLLIIAVVVFSLASLASGMTIGFASMLATRLIMGIAEGPVLPMAQSLMVVESSVNRRGFNMGLLQSSAPGLFGALLGPIVIFHLSQAYGWRGAFYISCIPGLILAFIIWKMVREPAPEELEKLHTGDGKADVSFWEIMAFRNIWICILISCFFVSWLLIFNSFAPAYMERIAGFTKQEVSYLSSAFGVGWVIWGFGVPGLSDRIGRKTAMIIFAALSIIAPLAVVHIHSFWALAFVLMATFAGPGCFVIFMANIPSETVPPKYLATALGMVMGIGEIFGGGVAPALAGMAIEPYGEAAPFYIAAVGAAVAFLLSFFLIETAPLKLKKMAANLEPSGA